jgi:hypothetical protein
MAYIGNRGQLNEIRVTSSMEIRTIEDEELVVLIAYHLYRGEKN